MKSIFILLHALFLFSTAAFSQSRIITGQVKDVNGNPLPYATVIVKGANGTVGNGVSADENGNFKIDAGNAKTLVLSSAGYDEQQVEIGNQTNILVALKSKSLSEVVVTGIGVATSKAMVPLDIATLSNKDVAKSALGSVEQALIGKVAGAQVQFNSGTPGTGASIILRGLNTLGSSYPLIMVDGIEVSDLNGLDLGNVERVEVVKGAAAGMLYGAQGANGVIQVFTKRGAYNRKPQVTFFSQASRGTVLKGKHSLIAKYHSFETDAQGYATANGVRIAPDANGSWPAPDYLDPAVDPNVQNNKPYKEQTFDHLKQAYKPATTFNNTISITGGGERSDYAFTVSRYDEENVLNNTYNKTSLAANLGVGLAKGLSFRNSLQAIFTNEDLLSGDADASIAATTANRFGLFSSFPFIDFTRRDSSGHTVVSANQGDRTTLNPLSEAEWRDRNSHSNRIIENANVNYKFPRFIELDYKYGLELWNTDETNYYHNQSASLQASVAKWGQNINGSILNNQSKFTKQNSILSAYIRTDFQKDFKSRLPITTVTQLTYDYRKTEEKSFFALGTVLPSYPPFNITVAQSHTSGEGLFPGDPLGRYTFITYGILFNQSIDYKELLGISAGLRSDYSSAFGSGSKAFTFPRGTVYFRPTQVFHIKGLNEWKLRAAYGEAGIQPGTYDRQPTLTVAPLGTVSTISNPFQIPNTELRVQQSRELEIGTDATFSTGLKTWLEKINLSFSYWKHTNFDIIQPADVALSTGYGKKLDNLTSINSKGWDFSLDADMISSKDLNWLFNFRIGTAKSVATKISNGADLVNGIFTVKQGQELGLFSFQAPLTSLDQLQEDGKTPYIEPADRGGYQLVDGVVVDTATKMAVLTNATDQKAVGNAYPKFTASFINTFTIKKNFVFSFQWDWYQGNKIYNITRQWLYRDRLSADYDKPITVNGKSGAYVNFYNSLYNSVSPLTWFVEDGSFLRLRDVSLTYDLGAGLHMNWAKQLSLTVSGRNLLTITKYSGLDPEATNTADSQGNEAGGSGQYSGAIKGSDYFAVPNLKSFQVSLRVGF